MNRLISGLVLPIALLAIGGCNSEPTGDLRNGATKLVASPTQLFIDLGRNKTVEIGAVDGQGNPIEAEYLITDVGSGISVVRDSTFQPVFGNDSTLVPPRTAPRFRFIVTATAFGKTSFTVEGAGQSITVSVQVVPNTDFPATFSNANPALGDTIVLTAPPGTQFTASSEVTTGDTLLPPRTLAVASDGSTISFLLPPNVNSPVTVTHVVAGAAPTLEFTPTTVDAVHTPAYDSVDVAFSTATPTLGQSVTATITDNPLVKFDTNAVLSFPGTLPGPRAGPQNIVVAADSSSLTFDAPPNAAGPATVTSFSFPGDYSIILPTRATVTVLPNIGDSLAATFDDPTPDALQVVKITAPPNFKFDATVDATGASVDTVAFTGVAAIIKSVAADGSSIDIIPIPGSAGPATITGVIPTAATQFSVTMPTKTGIAKVPELTPLEGTEDPTTAPTVTVPSSFNDAGTFGGTDLTGDGGLAAQYYKIDVPAGAVTISVDWVNASDVDLVVCDDVGGVLDDTTCDLQAATGAQPESGTYTLTAGVHYVAIVLFDGAPPPFITLTLGP